MSKVNYFVKASLIPSVPSRIKYILIFFFKHSVLTFFHISRSSLSKESACSARDPGSIPGSGGSPGEGNSNPLQYPCLENPLDRGAWRDTVHGVTKSWTRLNNYHRYSSSPQGSWRWMHCLFPWTPNSQKDL